VPRLPKFSLFFSQLGRYFAWLLPVGLLILSLVKLIRTPFPAPTSWLPADVGITKFIDHWGWWQQWYPHWYLGLPFRWATGPLVPGLLLLFYWSGNHFPGLSVSFSWFNSGLILQVFLVCFGTLGSFFLGQKLFRHPLAGLTTSLVYTFFPGFVWIFPQLWHLPWGILFPWRILGSLVTGSLSSALPIALFPWALFITFIILPSKQRHPPFNPPLTIAIIALINCLLIFADPAIIISYLLFVGLYFFTISAPSNRWQTLIWGLFLGWITSLIWYPPDFWLQLILSPSLGGQPLWRVSIFLLRYLGTMFIVGWGITRWQPLASLSRQIKWALGLLVIFAALTLARFLKDPDFWLDYTTWNSELLLVIAFLISGLILRAGNRLRRFSLIILIVAASFQCWRIYHTSDKWLNSSPDPVYQHLLIWISAYSPSSGRLFVSGTPVPWVSGLEDVSQLRGGRDQIAPHPYWAMVAYQVRTGDSTTLSAYWLRALGITDLVVHSPDSSEFWHDFLYPDKFAGYKDFQLLESTGGDYWYHLSDSSLARVTDPQILTLPPPESATDAANLESYLHHLGHGLPASWITPYQISVNSASNASSVSLAVTSDGGWQAQSSTGVNLLTQTDSLGNLLISNPEHSDQITVSRRHPFTSPAWWWPLLAGILCLLCQPLTQFLSHHSPQLHLGLFEDDDRDY
jgi:hypothetical protein